MRCPHGCKDPIISFKNFSFQYRAQKKPTLQDISLDVTGRRVLIAGLRQRQKHAGRLHQWLEPLLQPRRVHRHPNGGRRGCPHSSIFDLAGHVGTVLQDPDGQFIGLTVGEDIAFSLENNCTPQPEMKAIVQHAAELVCIENHLGFAPQEFPAGRSSVSAWQASWWTM